MSNETIYKYRSLSLYFLKSLQIFILPPNWIYSYASCHYEVLPSPSGTILHKTLCQITFRYKNLIILRQ